VHHDRAPARQSTKLPAAERNHGIVQKFQFGPNERELERGLILVIPHQEICHSQCEHIRRAAARHTIRAMTTPAQILHRREHSGPQDFHSRHTCVRVVSLFCGHVAAGIFGRSSVAFISWCRVGVLRERGKLISVNRAKPHAISGPEERWLGASRVEQAQWCAPDQIPTARRLERIYPRLALRQSPTLPGGTRGRGVALRGVASSGGNPPR
jgi:hypothetical protein